MIFELINGKTYFYIRNLQEKLESWMFIRGRQNKFNSLNLFEHSTKMFKLRIEVACFKIIFLTKSG